ITAVTRAGTLSRVMISWGGTSMVTVLRSILTILSTNGKRMKRPGPLAPPWTRPRRKMTPLSYSLTILMALNISEKTNMAIITRTIAANPIPTACNKPKVAYTRDPPFILGLRVYRPAVVRSLHRHHLHHPSSVAETHHPHLAPHPYHRLAIRCISFPRSERQHGLPPLAVHEHPPLRLQPDGAPDGAHLADHPLPAGYGRPPSECTRRTQDAEENAPHEHRDDPDGAEQRPCVRDTGH